MNVDLNKERTRGRFFRAVTAAVAILTLGTGLMVTSPAVAATNKDTLVVAIPGDIDNFDPHTNQLLVYGYAIRRLVFSSLIKLDKDLKVQPDLATSYKISADATTYTFNLNPKATFHDGTPVTAASVIASMKRVGNQKSSIWANRVSSVDSYTAADANTVVITLKAANASFLNGLADIAIVPESNFANVGSHPIGTGPYKFVSWEANKQITLQRYDGYFGTPSPTKTLIEKPITDQQVALNALYSGSVDVIASASSTLVSQVDKGRAKVIQPTSTNSQHLIEFNVQGKLKDVRVRQALAYALDKRAIAKIAFGGKGSNTWSVLPESNFAYKLEKGYPYSLARAAGLLKAAKVSNLNFTLQIPTGFPEAVDIARVWQASLAKIGVTMKVNLTEISVWLDFYVPRKYDASWNLFDVGPDPSNFWNVIMAPHLTDDYKNATVIKLVADGLATGDQSKRIAIYGQLQDIMVKDLPVMELHWAPVAALISPKVTGYQINPYGWALLDQAAVTN
jgi:peptide/nickel transport system substrate-binding protein